MDGSYRVFLRSRSCITDIILKFFIKKLFSIFQMSEYGYGHHGFRPYGNPMHGARGGGPGGDRGEHRGDRGEGKYQL